MWQMWCPLWRMPWAQMPIEVGEPKTDEGDTVGDYIFTDIPRTIGGTSEWRPIWVRFKLTIPVRLATRPHPSLPAPLLVLHVCIPFMCSVSVCVRAHTNTHTNTHPRTHAQTMACSVSSLCCQQLSTPTLSRWQRCRRSLWPTRSSRPRAPTSVATLLCGCHAASIWRNCLAFLI